MDHRALARATLARQHLIERTAKPPDALAAHLVGLQAQEPQSWYVTFWTRLRDFDPRAVGQLLEARHLVRLTLMRATVHLVTAEDALELRRFTQPTIDRFVRGKSLERLGEVDLEALAAEVREASREPRRTKDLLDALAVRWPEADRFTLSLVAKTVVPLVQVPPRGVWGRAGTVRLTPLETWVGRPLPVRVDAARIVRRYLAAFGPASVADAQAWSGVTRLREVFERLRDELATFRSPSGEELFDLPEAPRPGDEVRLPVRFLANYDNILLGHRDRSRFSGERHRELLTYVSGPYPSMLLVGGRIAGHWFLARDGDTARLVVRTVEPLAPDDEADLHGEGEALLAFLAPGATERRLELGSLGHGAGAGR